MSGLNDNYPPLLDAVERHLHGKYCNKDYVKIKDDGSNEDATHVSNKEGTFQGH